MHLAISLNVSRPTRELDFMRPVTHDEITSNLAQFIAAGPREGRRFWEGAVPRLSISRFMRLPEAVRLDTGLASKALENARPHIRASLVALAQARGESKPEETADARLNSVLKSVSFSASKGGFGSAQDMLVGLVFHGFGAYFNALDTTDLGLNVPTRHAWVPHNFDSAENAIVATHYVLAYHKLLDDAARR